MSRSGVSVPRVVVIRVDQDLRVVAFNAAAEESFGVKAADTVGKGLDALVDGTGESISGVLTGRPVWIPPANGTRPGISLTPSLDERGAVSGAVGIGVEGTSALVASSLIGSPEARLSLIETHTNEWITLNTLEGTIVYSTPSAMALIGYQPGELVGRAGYEFIHPEDLPNIVVTHENAFDQPEGYEVRYRLRHKSGRWIWCESYAKVIDDADGNPSLIIGSSRNVTQRHRAEELLRSALAQERGLRHQLESANEQRREVAAIVTHDLVGSLSAVAGFADAIKAGGQADDDLLGKIGDVARRALSRVTELRDSMADEMRAAPRAEPVDLGPIATAVAAEFGLPEWVVEGEGIVTGDPRALEHVIHNLVSNAAKYASGSRVEIRIEDGTGRVRCSVVDHGPGVDPEERDSIFERFSRGATAGSISGVGLGLGYVRATVESQGGMCGVDETPGGGATFWFELPAA